MSPRFLLPPLAALVFCAPAFAQPPNVQINKRLPVISATAASGRWREQAAFDPATYGKVRGVSPATSPETKVVLYTDELSDDFFKIAQAVDDAVAGQPEADWSFVQVTDAKGAQYGGYTASEASARLAQIQTVAKKHGIKNLSFLLAAPGSHTAQPRKIVVIAHTQTGENRYKSGVVDWTITSTASELQGDALAKQIAALKAVLGSKPK